MTKTDKKQKNGPAANEVNRVPALFSPLMSVLFTLLFTPMFGAFLQGTQLCVYSEMTKKLAARNMGWGEVDLHHFCRLHVL